MSHSGGRRVRWGAQASLAHGHHYPHVIQTERLYVVGTPVQTSGSGHDHIDMIVMQNNFFALVNLILLRGT